MPSYISKDGVLILSATEKKNLEIMFQHIIQDINAQDGGTYTKESKKIDWDFDEAQANKSLVLIKKLRTYIDTCVA